MSTPPTPEPAPVPRSVLLGWSAEDAAETERLIELLVADDYHHRRLNRTDAYRYCRRAVLLDLIGHRADFGDPADAWLAEYLEILRRTREMMRAPIATAEPYYPGDTSADLSTHRGDQT